MINPLCGMKDLAFEDGERFEYIVKTASDIAKRYGYGYIETPILEEVGLFKRSVGESSDIVGKEMYEFTDRGGEEICMRPEGTAGIVRSFVSTKLDRQPIKQKFYYFGPMFRHETPQKGRLREFHQFGCESFGEGSAYEDFTIITMAAQIFDALGIEYELKINSLGCSECRPAYREKLVGFLEETKGELCEDCDRRRESNPIRTLDCKNEKCQAALWDSPKITENLCVCCDDDFVVLNQLLEKEGVKYTIDTGLVRGLDYYNKTAFEFVSKEIGAQASIAGGGRYDKLVESLDGLPTPAVGFALGIERIMELVKMPEPKREGYYIGGMSEEAIPLIVSLAKRKRLTDKVTIDYSPRGFKSHMKGVDKSNAKYLVLVGQAELESGVLRIKDMETKEEKEISTTDF